MEENTEFTLSCKVGKFIFPKGTIGSHAKLIRDNIMGQMLSGSSPKLKTGNDCYKYAKTFTGGLDEVPFRVVILGAR